MSRTNALRQALRQTFADAMVSIDDQSHAHAGHFAQAVESHFSITVISSTFEGKTRLQRQRMALQAIALVTGWHAMSWQLYTPDENQGNTTALATP